MMPKGIGYGKRKITKKIKEKKKEFKGKIRKAKSGQGKKSRKI